MAYFYLNSIFKPITNERMEFGQCKAFSIKVSSSLKSGVFNLFKRNLPKISYWSLIHILIGHPLVFFFTEDCVNGLTSYGWFVNVQCVKVLAIFFCLSIICVCRLQSSRCFLSIIIQKKKIPPNDPISNN